MVQWLSHRQMDLLILSSHLDTGSNESEFLNVRHQINSLNVDPFTLSTVILPSFKLREKAILLFNIESRLPPRLSRPGIRDHTQISVLAGYRVRKTTLPPS